ncbi:MAG: alpha-L-fucosidase [Candidatus Hydrogenedentes bacterium]|nr:alpha-L-fucosidase [Candidatus Hydrogenedentota bacterium]
MHKTLPEIDPDTIITEGPKVRSTQLLRVAALFAILWGGAAAPAWTQPPESPPPPPSGYAVDYDVPYSDVSVRQKLDIVYPKETAKACPAVILIHSGGWYTGGKGGESTLRQMYRFAEEGYVALSIGYRLTDEAIFPAAVEDCKLAVRWLRAHAKEYGVDPTRIAAMGASAGGHLSAMLAVTQPGVELEGRGGYAEESSAIQAAVPVCAPLDLRVPLSKGLAHADDPLVVQFLGGPLAEKAEEARRASPLSYVRPGLPPMLLVHGSEDKRVDPGQTTRMAEALGKAGCPYEVIIVEGGKHGMGIARDEPVSSQIIAFLNRYLRPGEPGVLNVTPAGRAETLRWWRDAKFGMFIHWGPASIKGEEISWSRGGVRPGLPDLPLGAIPIEEYDSLYRQFNPAEFNAEEWVQIARDAGMKYLVFTTKHHDGFCMFDSQLTEYDIAAAPYAKDLLKDLAKACHDKDFGLGLYYSLPDWHHPAYLTDRHEDYVTYLHGQIRELCGNYGAVDVLWFDGKQQGTAETWGSPALVGMMRELQPRMLINDRIWGDTDFDTPEQVIGRFEPNRPWESCITLGQQWGWKPEDRIKPWEECVQLLVRAAGGGGNLLLNVGPMPSGEIEARQVKVLTEIGAWLTQYGESIYGTRGGPYPPTYWGASTHRENTIYLHVFEGWESALELPGLERTVVASEALGGGAVEVRQDGDRITLQVPEGSRCPPDTVVRLTLDGDAATIAPKPTNMAMPEGATASGSNVRRGEAKYTADKAVDADPMSRWATDDGEHSAWMEIRLPKPITFDVMMIDEAFGPRVEAFALQAKDGTEWKTFYEGSSMGRNWAGRFPPVTASEIRIEIVKANDGPTFRDVLFHVIPEK